MSISSSIKQMVENIARSLAITSASPDFTNRVKYLDYFGETGDFDEILRADVVQIIQDEIKIQLTEVRQEELVKDTPSGSVESQVASNIKKGFSVAQNPATAASDMIKYLPHAALVTLAISLGPLLFKELTRDGSLLDLRFRRRLLNEQNSFLDRQTQRNTQIGLRQVIIQSRAGFIQMNGAGGNENTIRQVRDGGVDGNRLAQIDMTDHAKELFSP